MTYATNSALPQSVLSSVPDEPMRTLFRTSLNSHLRDGKSETMAFIKAYRALEDAGCVRTEKGVLTVESVHEDGPIGATVGGKKPKIKDDPGTDPADIAEFPDEVDDAGVDDVDKKISGNSDIPLNDKGNSLAKRLGERLAAKGGLDVIHSSPLKRAVETVDAIVEAASKDSVQEANPTDALCPWHLGEIEGRESEDVKGLIAHYVEHPDEAPPGEGADGEKAESFRSAVRRQLDFLSETYKDSEDMPEAKIGVVMHSRGMEVLQAWVDAEQPDDFEVDAKDMLNPDDPDHADVLRWHGGKVKDVDLESDDPLKPGVYLILHSLTDDDADSGNKDLKKLWDIKASGTVFNGELPAPVKKFMPPLEVYQAANLAWASGVSVEGVTSDLIEGTGLGADAIRKVAEWHAAVESGSVTPTEREKNAWGGAHAKKWAARVVRKIEKEEVVAKAGNGVLLAFWPSAEVAKKLAVEGGEAADQLHVTLAYFGKPDEVGAGIVSRLEEAVKGFAETHGPIEATFSKVGKFPATPQSDGKDVVYLAVDSPDIQEFRKELVACSKEVGADPKANFEYTPHMTLAYVDAGKGINRAEYAPEKPVPVTFDEVTLSTGTSSKRFKLGVEKQDFEIEGEIVSKNAAEHLVFGIFSLTSIDGKPIFDTQDDAISTKVIENAAYDFVLNARNAGNMHEQTTGIGKLVESMVFTDEKAKALLASLKVQKIDAVMDLKCILWWGGFKVEDEDTWKKVVSGELKAFSIGGRGKRAAL